MSEAKKPEIVSKRTKEWHSSEGMKNTLLMTEANKETEKNKDDSRSPSEHFRAEWVRLHGGAIFKGNGPAH